MGFGDVLTAMVPSFVQAGSNIGAGALQAQAQREANRMNYELTKESWARDDVKHQRNVKDLKAAGINPILASGMNPSNSNVGNAQQPATGMAEGVKGAGSAIAEIVPLLIKITESNADISRTQAQAELIKAQTEYQGVSTEGALHNLEWARDTNQPIGSPGTWSPASVLQLIDEIKSSLVDRGGEEAYGFLDALQAQLGSSNGDKPIHRPTLMQAIKANELNSRIDIKDAENERRLRDLDKRTSNSDKAREARYKKLADDLIRSSQRAESRAEARLRALDRRRGNFR